MAKLSARHVVSSWAAGVLAASLLFAGPLPGSRAGGREAFDRVVFSPELLVANQRRIGLTPEQRETLVGEMRQTKSDVLPLEVEMAAAAAELIELLESPRVDEEAAQQAAARVLELERQVKSRRMLLLIRIKNLLTEEQQEQLEAIRDEE